MSYTNTYSISEPTREELNALRGPVLVEFGAPWCGFCVDLEPHIADLLRGHPEVRHIKVYDGRGKPLGRSFRVKLWPSLIFMRDGKVIMQMARPDEAEVRAGLAAIWEIRQEAIR